MPTIRLQTDCRGFVGDLATTTSPTLVGRIVSMSKDGLNVKRMLRDCRVQKRVTAVRQSKLPETVCSFRMKLDKNHIAFHIEGR